MDPSTHHSTLPRCHSANCYCYCIPFNSFPHFATSLPLLTFWFLLSFSETSFITISFSPLSFYSLSPSSPIIKTNIRLPFCIPLMITTIILVNFFSYNIQNNQNYLNIKVKVKNINAPKHFCAYNTWTHVTCIVTLLYVNMYKGLYKILGNIQECC